VAASLELCRELAYRMLAHCNLCRWKIFGALAMSANVVSLNERRPRNRMRSQDKPAAPSSSDPIFAAIERYKVAVAELEKGDGSYLNEVEAALAEYALLDTVPTNAPGPANKNYPRY
jgi:hypothetical protein